MSVKDEILRAFIAHRKDCKMNWDVSLEPVYTDKVIEIFEKTIDKVEQDYKNELNNWGKSQPMKDMYPREMKTLERIRKELN